jgi:hypothetical protein
MCTLAYALKLGIAWITLTEKIRKRFLKSRKPHSKKNVKPSEKARKPLRKTR